MPGWYPHPERPGALLYWDGALWVHPPGPVLPRGKPVNNRSFIRLSKAVTTGLILVGLVIVAQAALYIWGTAMIDGAVATSDAAKLDRFDTLDQALTIGLLVLVVATGIAWVVWQHQVASTAASGDLRHGPGMHAGAWFIPFANLVIPCQNVRDLWGFLLRTPSKARVSWWWATILIGALLTRIGDAKSGAVEDVADFRSSMTLYILASVPEIVSAVLAVTIVRRLTVAGLARSAELRGAGIPDA
jgi:hypothetical protein